ncbi:MAG TPA: glycogen debranching N-terminal domain-containing protein [Gaiellaceae bacterium]|nr:glycogen debranching N-terminal domain-containing protein [Gaiellaceae bacterium]
MALTILEGSTFCVSDELGDISEPTMGFFARDTRFLSRWALKINGATPLVLASRKVEYYSAAFFLRNPVVGDLAHDEISIGRERFVGDSMQEHIVVQNHSRRRLAFDLALELGNDFADIFAVKEYDFALGDPEHARPLPPAVAPVYEPDGNQFVIAQETEGFHGITQVVFSERGEASDSTATYRVELGPRESWRLRVDVIPAVDGIRTAVEVAERRFGDELARVRASLAAWRLRVPQLRGSWDELSHTFAQSVADLSSLRMDEDPRLPGQLPAAGMPWFMTIFGRDTLITCLQTLLFGPELAQNALAVLAELQATEDDPAADAEPGKIVHEVRHGQAARAWFPRYYGTVDATPLYLVLLSEVWRWTDDAALVRDLRGPALRALDWIDRYGDLDGDGFVEYERRSPGGLVNQSWKDSGDSQLFRDGSVARAPIAPCEVQGYVYDAKLRLAELARDVWRERELAERLEREAAALRDRFDEAFWCEARGGYYALALDADKERVDALTSNIGHLLWSGIVPPERVDAVVDQLMGEELWSGWGVRTMSSGDAGFNPLAYHNGTVWPHDNALVAWGLARYGRWPEAQRIVRRMLNAASYFGHQLPEVFAGFSRTDTPFPIPYPTAARPQAWAAGTPVLLLQVLLGVEPDRRRHVLGTIAPGDIPSWAGDLRVSGVRAFDRAWDVQLHGGRVSVEQA